MSEEQIISACKKGDKKGQAFLVDKYGKMLYTVCRRYACDDAMAYDFVQETFILIFTNIQKYKPIGSFEAWIRRIAINCSLAWIKKTYLKKEIALESILDDRKEEPEIFSQLGEEVIIAHIQTLPDGYRSVFNLYTFEDLSHKEIAAILNISESTSRSQLLKARRMLAHKMKDIPKIHWYGK